MIKDRIKTLMDQLSTGVYERERELGLALLSAIAGESIFLLGKPGVAKSLIARRLKLAFADSTDYEYLMSRFSTPDELFGPVKISMLKDNDVYERQTKGYLPSADVVFLDEIWKAGPAIQNALLTIINEKVFRNGDNEIQVPMKALISASNELPAKGEGLEALWDRFLVRLVVDGIKDHKKFEEMISGQISVNSVLDISNPISSAEYSAWQTEIDKIRVTQSVFHIINSIRVFIAAYNETMSNDEQMIYISDRRWKKIVRLMKTAAFLNDRSEVSSADCWLISHCIWNEDCQIAEVKVMVSKAIEKSGLELNGIVDGIKEKIDKLEQDIVSLTHYKEVVSVPIFSSNFVSRPVIIAGEWLNLFITPMELEKLANSNVTSPVSLSGKIQSAITNSVNAQADISAYFMDGNKLVLSSVSVNKNSSGWPQEKYIDEINKSFSGTNMVRTTLRTEEVERIAAPSEQNVKHWESVVEKLTEAITKAKLQLDNYSKTELENMKNSLFFVPEDMASLAQNVEQTYDKLNELTVNLSRVRNSYCQKDGE